MRIRRREVALTTEVGGAAYEYTGSMDDHGISLAGAHRVNYLFSAGSELLVGGWEDEGLEELIPAKSSMKFGH